MSGGALGYPEYRDPGLAWLGQIPVHWEVNRAKVYLREVDERSVDGSEERLSVSHLTGVTPRREKNVTMFEAESYVGHKVCRPGDVVVNTMWAWMGALGVAKHDGIVSPSYAVYRLRNKETFDHRYLDSLLRTPSLVAEFRRHSTGIQESRLRLYPERLLSIALPHPPADEQRSIADYLAAHRTQIQRFRRAKQRLMALLAERQDLVIRRIILGEHTAGPRRPIDGAWYDSLPINWTSAKLRTVVRVLGGMTPTKSEETYWSGAMPWVSPKDMKVAVLTDAQDHISEAAVRKTGIPVVPCPSVLMVVRGMILARDVPVAVALVPVTINQDMKALMPQPGVDTTFLYYALRAAKRHLKERVEVAGHGTRKLPTSAWRDLAIPVPPLDEQRDIVAHIERQFEEEGRLLSAERGAVRQVDELSARVTADVVTGRVDVRHMIVAAVAPRVESVAEIDADNEDEAEDAELVVSDAD